MQIISNRNFKKSKADGFEKSPSSMFNNTMAIKIIVTEYFIILGECSIILELS